MNAVIDIGNTKIKIGLFASNVKMEVSTLNLEDVEDFLLLNKVQKVLVSNVGVKSDFIKLLERLPVSFDEFTIKTPMPIATMYQTPSSLGVDRLAACVGARNYTQGDVLVIDAGSCITYDMLTSENSHRGGIITPGLEMRLKAMHTFTSNLPLVPFKKEELVGNSTKKCLQSGVANGSLAEMKGLIEGFMDEFQNLSIIIGGGDAVFFDKNLKLNTFVVSNLAVEGLHAIFKYNE